MEKSFECKKLGGFFCRVNLRIIFWKIFLLGKIFWVGNYERVNCPMEIPPLELGRKAPPAMKKVPRNRAGN